MVHNQKVHANGAQAQDGGDNVTDVDFEEVKDDKK